MESSRRHPKARTVALVGRAGSGKTSLLEAMVVAGGGLHHAGKVEDGSALGGRDPEERAHQTSLGMTLAPVWVGEDKLTLVDTPGFIDFYGDVERALDVADVAMLVVSAVDGVQADTAVLWDMCRSERVPVVIVINQLDAERADFEATLGALEKLVGPALAPLELPIGLGSTFSGIVDLLADEAITYNGATKKGPVPEDLADLEHRVRDSLIEAIVIGDDSMTEKYLEGEVPSIDELEGVLGRLMVEGRIFPVTCASATKAVGVDRLITLLDEVAESRPIAMLEKGQVVELARDPAGDPVLRAFKVIVDNYVGRIVVMEVVSGTVANEAVLVNARTRSDERLHGLSYLFGSKLVPVDKAVTGDVVAVAKLSSVQVGDVLEKKGRDLAPLDIAAHTPGALGRGRGRREGRREALGVAAQPGRGGPVAAGSASTRRPGPRSSTSWARCTCRSPCERLKRRFSLGVTTDRPPVPYFETIIKPCDVEGRLKKQTGGHGQFAVVNVKVEPKDPTEPFEFVDQVVGGSVPRQYIPAVMHGIERAMAHGGPNGQPVVGVRATLYDGKYHSVDSSEAAFETAGSMALKAAIEKSGTTLLERVMLVEVTVPGENLGDVLTDLSGRRGKVMGTDTDESGATKVSAHVPEAELARYGLELRSLSGGRGKVSITPHHLAEAPKTALK